MLTWLITTVILLLLVLAIKLTVFRDASPEKKETPSNICPCGHHLCFHDPQTFGRCYQEINLHSVRGNKCDCQQYLGPPLSAESTLWKKRFNKTQEILDETYDSLGDLTGIRKDSPVDIHKMWIADNNRVDIELWQTGEVVWQVRG